MTHSTEAGNDAAGRRNDLILDHLPQVHLIARRMLRGLPPTVQAEDLFSAGILGLIAAVDRFDPTQDVKLKTYAEHKIRGAILDSLRGAASSPRQYRRRARLIEAATCALERELGRAPWADEVAARLGLELSTYQTWQAEAHFATTGLLQAGCDKDGKDPLRNVADSPQRLPSAVAEQAEVHNTLEQALAGLPEVQQTVMRLHFYEGETVREIAGRVGLHESRVSQLKSQALGSLRSTLSKKDGGFTREARPTESASYGRAQSARPLSCPVRHSVCASTR